LYDFLVATFYMIFSVVALAAGIVSIANSAWALLLNYMLVHINL
jgi:hypothetical protein